MLDKERCSIYWYLSPLLELLEERYIEMLKQWKMDEDVIGDVLKNKINNVEAKVDNVQAAVDRIETQLVPRPGK